LRELFIGFGKTISCPARASGLGERRLPACSRRQLAYGIWAEKIRSCAKKFFGKLPPLMTIVAAI
jgi:hypothetical protein